LQPPWFESRPSDSASKTYWSVLYTIGHSTRAIEDLIRTLRTHQIQTLADIRAFPMSRRMSRRLPQFHRDSLEKTLPAAGIRYLWMKALGGCREKILDESPNLALRNQRFRNYADLCGLYAHARMRRGHV
jgi:uncharacterized protein (DUF488 family)